MEKILPINGDAAAFSGGLFDNEAGVRDDNSFYVREFRKMLAEAKKSR